MKRVTVLHKVLWDGRHTKDIYKVLRDYSDSAIQETLNEMNKPYKKWFWEVMADYHLSRKADQYAYADYCLNCAKNRFCHDEDSREVGLCMINSALMHKEG